MNKVLLELVLLKQIDEMKEKLVEVTNSTGINSKQSIKCSQELDKLLNIQIKFYSNKESSNPIVQRKSPLL